MIQTRRNVYGTGLGAISEEELYRIQQEELARRASIRRLRGTGQISDRELTRTAGTGLGQVSDREIALKGRSPGSGQMSDWELGRMSIDDILSMLGIR